MNEASATAQVKFFATNRDEEIPTTKAEGTGRPQLHVVDVAIREWFIPKTSFAMLQISFPSSSRIA
jgi:hypothetical protein